MNKSWVIREKATGGVLFETYSAKLVAALNTAKYEAVPILEYLVGVNQGLRNIKESTETPVASLK